jgi:hypothetical protein
MLIVAGTIIANPTRGFVFTYWVMGVDFVAVSQGTKPSLDVVSEMRVIPVRSKSAQWAFIGREVAVRRALILFLSEILETKLAIG